MATIKRNKPSLLVTNPELAKEWDYEKNAPLTPEDVTTYSHKKVFWRCLKNHSWEATIASRTNMKSGCPFCSGRLAIKGINDLQTIFPEIAKEWHPTKNGLLMPDNVKFGCSKKVWWKCSKGHEWEATIDSRTSINKTGCPYCSGGLVIKGKNDLQTLYPDVAKEWHPTKNGSLNPDSITAHNSKKVWWLGICGHEWDDLVSNRTGQNVGCPYCSGRRVLKGYNDLQTIRPEVAKKWNYAKNNGFTPSDVTVGSRIKVWWMCEYGHEWKATVVDRVRGTDCPYCANKLVLSGFNDLETRNPDIAKEWHPTKNGGIKPSDVTSGSEKKVWWVCERGHEYIAAINHRTVSGNKCPYCSGRYVIQGENDLQTLFPEIAKEWHSTKNGGLKPSDVKPGSGKRVWWRCQFGHEWKVSVASRTGTFKTGCPKCSSNGTSIPEQGLSFYIEQVCKVEQRIKLFGQEVDVYLPDYNLGVEYDGILYHTEHTTNKEDKKDRILSDHDIKIIRIKESDVNEVSDNRVIRYKVDYLGTNYEWALKQLCNVLYVYTDNDVFKYIDINVKRDELKIRERAKTYKHENSISVLLPDLAKEWDYDNNGVLTPEMFTVGSDIKVWWRCPKNHSYRASIGSRVRRANGLGCPYCNGGIAKSVRNIDTGEVFDSMKDAASKYGMTSSNPISLCCLGKQKTAGGYHWEYVDQID